MTVWGSHLAIGAVGTGYDQTHGYPFAATPTLYCVIHGAACALFFASESDATLFKNIDVKASADAVTEAHDLKKEDRNDPVHSADIQPCASHI